MSGLPEGRVFEEVSKTSQIKGTYIQAVRICCICQTRPNYRLPLQGPFQESLITRVDSRLDGCALLIRIIAVEFAAEDRSLVLDPFKSLMYVLIWSI
jgi:hypothetical protein